MSKSHLLDLHPRDWQDWFVKKGGKKFHSKIAARWVFREGIYEWQKMTDLPQDLRDKLEEFPILSTDLMKEHHAKDGAQKILIRLEDDSLVEAVSMPGTQGKTICISTQVGCGVKCSFCASGLDGLKRNLKTSEILQQVFWLRKTYGDFHRIVIMGMGEPGHNIKNVLDAMAILISKEGSEFSGRRITLSTVAPPGAISAVTDFSHTIQLAISLHAPTDSLRKELVPGTKNHSIKKVLEEAELYFSKTGREFTIEYVLLKEVNDSPRHAQELAELLRNSRCHINLIPFNTVEESGFSRPDDHACENFYQTLRDNSFSVTLRNSMGKDKNAACGQLRRRTIGIDV